MGEMADFYIDQMQDAYGWSPVGTRRRDTRTRMERNQTNCKHCGADVHWRETEDGWRLYDNERQHPGNRYIEHHCPTTPEGFDEEPV